MKITPNIKALIRSGLEARGLLCVDLTEHLNRPKSFSTKLFNGTLKNLTDADADAICAFLDLRFVQVTEQGRISDTAIRLSNLMDKSDTLATSITHLVDHLELLDAIHVDATKDRLTDLPRPDSHVVTDDYRPPASSVTDRKVSVEIETEHRTA